LSPVICSNYTILLLIQTDRIYVALKGGDYRVVLI
jgi:hypothetical protein